MDFSNRFIWHRHHKWIRHSDRWKWSSYHLPLGVQRLL